MSAFQARLREIMKDCENQEAEMHALFGRDSVDPKEVLSHLMKVNTRVRMLSHFLLHKDSAQSE